jgi:hypothetical protein
MSNGNGTSMVPVADIHQMAVAVANSQLFGIKNADQAMALMLIAQAEGMHPAIAARDYHVIQGRPALKADAMLARFQNAGGKVKWTSYTDAKVAGIFSHPSGGELEIEWTMDRAKAAGLSGKDNWKHYPRQMLRARVISEGVRTVCPGVTAGLYTPEEIQDAPPVERFMGEAEVVQHITEEQAKELSDLIATSTLTVEEFCATGAVSKLEEITPENFESAKRFLNKRQKPEAEAA